tara:strand:- start:4992 stop:5855 length:864 start_codon:yes stop_codon:yes gene_type:complete
MSSKGLNTKQVGDLFGVNESTVRRWALSGKIKCNSSAGGHRKFSFKNIISFSKSNKVKINSEVLEDSLNSEQSIENILVFSLALKSESIESILVKLYLSGVTLSKIMDDYIEPVLVKIQKKLDDEKISVAEEHIARKIVSKSLNSFKNSITSYNANNNKNVLCLNLENDIPDLPIDMIQILLESINFSVDNCGSHTSVVDLKKLLDNKKYDAIFIYMCDRQCCTSTVKDNIDKTNMDLYEISMLAKKYNIKLFLGGPSFKSIKSDTLKCFNTFTKYSESLLINNFLD